MAWDVQIIQHTDSPTYTVRTGNSRCFVDLGSGYEYEPNAALTSIENSPRSLSVVYKYSASGNRTIARRQEATGTEAVATLEKRIRGNQSSWFDRVAKSGEDFDVQVHTGLCGRPDVFGDYDRAIILEDCRAFTHTRSPISSLEELETSGESLEISARSIVEISRPLYERASIDGLVAQVASVNIDGIPAIVVMVDPLPSSSIKLYFTLDSGKTWFIKEIPYVSSGTAPVYQYSMAVGSESILISIDSTTVMSASLPDPRSNQYLGVNQVDIADAIISAIAYRAGEYYVFAVDGDAFLVNEWSMSSRLIQGSNYYSNPWICAHGGFHGVLAGGHNGQCALIRPNGGLRPESVGVSSHINSVWSGDRYLYTGHENGKLMRRKIGETAWSEAYEFPSAIASISFATNNVGYVLLRNDSSIYRTIDGGVQWTLVTSFSSQLASVNGQQIVGIPDTGKFAAIGRLWANGLSYEGYATDDMKASEEGVILLAD